MTRTRKKTRTTVAPCRAPPSASLLVPADSASLSLLASTSLSSSAVFFFRYLLWFGLSRRKENGRLFVVSLSDLFA
ncbi:unnamed protein product [Sphagnum troendelagicum]|uniref:Uncharacterized protein n=1 Tax=Sphagnum troendelagicum TaxID=128251 RepID=A0ABP0TNH5_9BRYO